MAITVYTYTSYVTVYLVVFLPITPYINRYIYGSGQPYSKPNGQQKFADRASGPQLTLTVAPEPKWLPGKYDGDRTSATCVGMVMTGVVVGMVMMGGGLGL